METLIVARDVHEREELLREGTALVPRIELRLKSGGLVSEVFAGFRAEDALSLYFDREPVYHFNSRKRLRRAFVNDRLIKAQRGKLVSMQRQRGPHSTDLLSHRLRPKAEEQFCRSLVDRIDWLREALHAGGYEVVGQVPADGDGLARLVDWLSEFQQVEIADGPRVGHVG